MKYAKNKAITLIELLLVIVIIAIIATFILFNANNSFNQTKRLEVLGDSDTLKSENLDYLVSEWRFNGPTGVGNLATNEDVLDTWGYNNGTIGGGPKVLEGSSCISGKCLEFDGTDDYINCGTAPSLTSQITLSAWVYADSEIGTSPIIIRTSGSEYGLWKESTKWRFQIKRSTSGIGVNSEEDVVTDSWVYLVGTFDGTYLRIYIDGILNATTTSAGVIDDATGGLYIAYSPYWKGAIDEVRIYNKALTISEVDSKYAMGLDTLFKKGIISIDEYNQRLDKFSILK